jgi:hypothetical protein
MLTCTRYRVTIAALQPLDLPYYLGSTIRGAFGHAFRAVACLAPQGLECPAPAQCPYHLIFETSPPPDAEALRTHQEIPRPFVIAPLDWRASDGETSRRQFQPGDELRFELVLIGRAQEFFPYFVVALREVNQMGRGRMRPPERSGVGRPNSREAPRFVEMRRIEALDGIAGEPRLVYDAAQNLVRGAAMPVSLDDCAAAPMPDGKLEVEFVTQMRLKHEGRFIRRPEFQILFRRLLGRLSSLARFHCGGPIELNFRELIETASRIRLTYDGTSWTKWQRYSSRQDRIMEWEGIVGRAVYEGDFTPFWPFLKFGERTHCGHGATFGLGRYRTNIDS